MEEAGITLEEKQKITAMSDLSNFLVPLENQAMQAVKNNDKNTAMNLVFGPEYQRNIKQIKQLQTDFLNIMEKRTLENIESIESDTYILWIISFSFVILLILVQILSAFFTRKLIIAPIIQLKDEMNELSEGRFATNSALVPDTSEIGSLVYLWGR